MSKLSAAQSRSYIIVQNSRPLKLQNSIVDGGYLVFATVKEAKDYGAKSVEISPAKDFGINLTPNVKAINVTEDDCSFQFKYNNRWH